MRTRLPRDAPSRTVRQYRHTGFLLESEMPAGECLSPIELYKIDIFPREQLSRSIDDYLRETHTPRRTHPQHSTCRSKVLCALCVL